MSLGEHRPSAVPVQQLRPRMLWPVALPARPVAITAMSVFAVCGLNIAASGVLLRFLEGGPRPVSWATGPVHALAPVLLAAAMILGFLAERRSLPRFLAWLTVGVVALPSPMAVLNLPPLTGPGLKLGYATVVLTTASVWFVRFWRGAEQPNQSPGGR